MASAKRDVPLLGAIQVVTSTSKVPRVPRGRAVLFQVGTMQHNISM